jgi:kynurenine 3-monooxygenase
MNNDSVIIVGAGLCGSLLGIAMAKRGFKVSMYERRKDMRKYTTDAGRSINLALSSRGINALKKVNLDHEVTSMCIPMTGRMIHTVDKQLFLSPYSGRSGEYINSVSRQDLNIMLLNEAENHANVSIHFEMNCIQVDLEQCQAEFIDALGNKQIFTADIIIGSDGSASALRKSMMAKSNALQFNYSQQFLSHGYKELSIPSGKDSGFQIEKNALHIWPRGSFMIIALPNLDGSFTVTMFHPFDGEEGFYNLDKPEKVKHFFKKYFDELIGLMPNYVNEFFHNPTGTLTTIKCYPWQAYGKTLLMGDAAHAIVPFYGQGMNASFEDVSVFTDVLDELGNDWTNVFDTFQQRRAYNTNAIADLAIDNFYEMRDKVSDAHFIDKRKIETQLEQQYKDYYSKYSMVTFRSDLPYESAMKLGRAQDDLLLDIVMKKKEISLEEIFKQIQYLHSQVKH